MARVESHIFSAGDLAKELQRRRAHQGAALKAICYALLLAVVATLWLMAAISAFLMALAVQLLVYGVVVNADTWRKTR